MTMHEFLLLLSAAGIAYDRAELSHSPKAGYQAAVRVGRALYSGVGVTCEDAADSCIAAAQLGSRPWA